MANKTKEDSKKKSDKKKETSANYAYADESVKSYHFADFVKLRSGPRGMLMSFGVMHPDTKGKALIVNEVLLPYDVAGRLQEIIGHQLNKLLESGQLRIENESESVEE